MAVTAANIHELYIAYFGRAADKAGLDYWLAEGQKEGVTIEVIAKSFFDQLESQAQYDLLKDPALVASAAVREAFLTEVYQNLFGRAPDADGLAYWSDVLLKGGKDAVGRIIIDIVGGAQDGDAQLIANKVEVSKLYAGLQEELKIQLTDADMNGDGFFDFVKDSNALQDLLGKVPTDPVAFELFKEQVRIEAEKVAAAQGKGELAIGAGNAAKPVDAKASSGDDVVVLDNTSALDGFASVDGGAGNDTLRLDAAITDKADAAKFKNFETLLVNGVAQDITLFSGIKQFEVAGTSTITLNDGTLVALHKDADVTLTKAKLDGTTDYAFVETRGNATLTVTGYEQLNLTAKQGGTLALTGAELGKLTLNNSAADDTATADIDESLLTLDASGLTGLKSIDAAASTGSLNLTIGAAVESVKTGAGADKISFTGDVAVADKLAIETGAGDDTITITGDVAAKTGDTAATAAGKLTINAGEGNDTIILSGAFDGDTVLTGGAGNDVFNLSGATGTITVSDFTQGQDKLNVGLTTIANFSKGEAVLTDGQLDLEQTLASLADGKVVWFQHGDNTYVAVGGTTAGYDAAEDTLITLTGTIDLAISDLIA